MTIVYEKVAGIAKHGQLGDTKEKINASLSNPAKDIFSPRFLMANNNILIKKRPNTNQCSVFSNHIWVKEMKAC